MKTRNTLARAFMIAGLTWAAGEFAREHSWYGFSTSVVLVIYFAFINDDTTREQ